MRLSAITQLRRAESGDQDAYRAYFEKKLKEWGIESPADLDDAKKKKFFQEVDEGWTSKEEKRGGFRQARHQYTVTKPLYGHHDVNTAYEVDDYPYSFKLRTKIRYWLEHAGKKGWRFVSQTLNPKTGAWNKPKASTYTEFAANMFLDEKGHVTWTGLGQYSDAEEILEFIKHFPQSDMSVLKAFVPHKINFILEMGLGHRVMTINDVPKPLSEHEKDEYKQKLHAWLEIAKLLHINVPEGVTKKIDEFLHPAPKEAKFQYTTPRSTVPGHKRTIKMTPTAPGGKASFLESFAKMHRLSVSRQGPAVLATGPGELIDNLISSLATRKYDVAIQDM